MGSGSGEVVTDIWRGTGPASLCTRRLSCQYNADWRSMHRYSRGAIPNLPDGVAAKPDQSKFAAPQLVLAFLMAQTFGVTVVSIQPCAPVGAGAVAPLPA